MWQEILVILDVFLFLQVGYVEEVNLGDCRRECIIRVMKFFLFGKEG